MHLIYEEEEEEEEEVEVEVEVDDKEVVVTNRPYLNWS